MGLIDKAKADIEQITSNLNEWGVSMVLTAVPGLESVTIVGLHTKHRILIDTDGNFVNTKNAHISVSEKFLTEAGYPVRNGSGEVSLINHRVSVKDSTGLVKEYVITEAFPDETIGLICCILGDYEA